MPAKNDKGRVAPMVPAAIASMAKINKFYGGGLPRPTLIGEPDRPVQELASGRVAYNSVSQALMGTSRIPWCPKLIIRNALITPSSSCSQATSNSSPTGLLDCRVKTHIQQLILARFM